MGARGAIDNHVEVIALVAEDRAQAADSIAGPVKKTRPLPEIPAAASLTIARTNLPL